MTLQAKVVKGLLWTSTRHWGRQGISFVIFVILSRLLEPAAFGIVALATIFTDFINLFLDMGFGLAIIQRTNLEKEHIDSAFWAGVFFGTIMMILGIFSSELIAGFFNEPELAPVIAWLSVGFWVFTFSSIQKAVLRRQLAFKVLAIRSIVAALVGGLAGVWTAFNGYGVWSLVVQNLVTAIVGAVILWRVSDWRPGFTFSKVHFFELFEYGLNIIGIKILEFFNKRSDDLLIGYYLGSTLLGYYTVAYRILLIFIKLFTGISTVVLFPAFSRLQNDSGKMRTALYKITKYTGFIAFPSFLGILLLAPELTAIFFGEKWLPSVPIIQILSLIGILHSVTLFNATVIKASGKPEWWLRIIGLTTLLNVAGFYIVVQWGIAAIAAAFVVVGYLTMPIALFAVRKLIDLELKVYFSQLVRPMIAALTMVIFVLGLKYFFSDPFSMIEQLAIYILGGVSIYLLTIQIIAKSIYQEIAAIIRATFPNLKLGKA